MPLFPEYPPARHLHRRHYTRTRQIGALVICLGGLLMLAARRWPGPGLWSALGLCLGLELILWGAHELPFTRSRMSPPGARLAATANRWFPGLLFAVRHLFITIAMLILLFSLVELHILRAAWETAVFGLAILLVPARRLAWEWNHARPSAAAEIIEALCHRGFLISVVVLATHVLVSVIIAESTPYGTDTIPLELIAWSIAMLIVVAQTVLFINVCRRLRPHANHPPKPPPGSAASSPASSAESW